MRVVVPQCQGGRVIAVAAVVIVVGLAIAARPAAAQRIDVQADGTLNVGFTQTTQGTAQPDPMPQAPDIKPTSTDALVTELRPGITVKGGSARLSWLASYVFGANLTVAGDQGSSFSNQANLALIASPTKYTTLTTSAAFAQGGTSFLVSQQAAESGQPQVRAPGNPNTVSASVAEALTWEAIPHLQLQEAALASISAPQDAFDDRNSSVIASLAIERPFARDIPGIELRSNVSWLHPLETNIAPYVSVTNDIRARWSHDFSLAWTGQVSAGLEQVFTDTGSKPLAFLPSGTAFLAYTYGDIGAALNFSHGSATNLQVGAVSLTDQLTARGVFVLDVQKARVISFSTGFLHNEPLGEISPVVSAGTGNVVQVDAGFSTALTRNVSALVRYSAGYQFDQGGDLQPTLIHIFLVGITASYRNTERPKQPLPIRGRRVDGTDSVGFPVIDDRLPAEEDNSSDQ